MLHTVFSSNNFITETKDQVNNCKCQERSSVAEDGDDDDDDISEIELLERLKCLEVQMKINGERTVKADSIHRFSRFVSIILSAVFFCFVALKLYAEYRK